MTHKKHSLRLRKLRLSLSALTNNLPAQYKYMLYGGAMLFSIILLMSVISLMIFSSALDQKERESMAVRVGHTAQTIENEIETYRRIMDTLYIDDSLHLAILNCSKEPEMVAYESVYPQNRYAYYYDNFRDIDQYIARLIGSCEFRPELFLYIADELLYYKIPTPYIGITSDVKDEEWYIEASSTERTQMNWRVVPYTDNSGTQQYNLTCSLALRRIHINPDTRIAYAYLSKDMRWLDYPLRRQIDTENGAIYIMDSDGTLIYCSDGDFEKGASVCSAVSESRGDSGTSGYTAYQRKSSIAYYDSIDSMNWTLVYLTGVRLDRPGSYPFQLFALICLVPIILLSLLLLVLSARIMTKRLASLTESVRKIDEEHLELDSQFSGGDEVGVLSDAFRKTLQMVRELLEKNRAAERERYLTELQILQERINPHFLYNTLSSINAMAVDIDAWSISEALSSLADFYRLSLSHGGEIITLSEELNILKKYMEICRLRFGDRVKVTIDIPEELYDNLTPKLILQPFFENSVLHGLRTRADVQDRIIVSASSDGSVLTLCIRDNGAGIGRERMEQIMHMAEDGRYHAISSTSRRIKLIYGPEYGIDIESTPGVGTAVYIRIPDRKA